MIRANSRLRQTLDNYGIEFVEHAAAAIQRILPHVEVSNWQEDNWAKPDAVWTSKVRDAIRVTIAIGKKDERNNRCIAASVTRRRLGRVGGTLDTREHDICNLVVQRLSEVVGRARASDNSASIQAIRDEFDEHVVAQHIEHHHRIQIPVSSVFDALHTLSEQSYENKSLTFGCLLDPRSSAEQSDATFPGDFLEAKKYKALSDGYRTAYRVASNGQILSLVDLEKYQRPTAMNYFPDWAERLAGASRHGTCGIALSRQGDILVFDEGTLRFTYRYGRWQYWNHAHLVKLLRDRARAQRVPPRILGRVVGAIYRAALDVSFRRCGGLFVILHRRTDLRKVVRDGDAISDRKRNNTDREFDATLENDLIQSMSRKITVELASLDGALVLANSGQILAYGAILRPKKAGRLRGTEGSRTKAAIGASNYGLAVKISSDGDIVVYHRGDEFIRV